MSIEAVFNTGSSAIAGNAETALGAVASQEVIRDLMQGLVLSNREVGVSLQAKDSAFAGRVENLTEMIRKLEAEREVLNRQLLDEESLVASRKKTQQELLQAVTEKVVKLKTQIDEQKRFVNVIKQETLALEASYQVKFQVLCNEYANGQLAARNFRILFFMHNWLKLGVIIHSSSSILDSIRTIIQAIMTEIISKKLRGCNEYKYGKRNTTACGFY